MMPRTPWSQVCSGARSPSPSPVLSPLASPQETDRVWAPEPCCRLTTAPLLPRPPTPLADRAFSTFPSFGSVGAWLEALDLGRYKDSFTAGGYGSLEAVAAMAAQ